MTGREPTTAELLAAAISIALAGRDLIERTDPANAHDCRDTLAALAEGMAVSGGSLLLLAEKLGMATEIDRLVKQGQDRLSAFYACQGMEGRA